MYKKAKFLFFCMIFVAGRSFSQVRHVYDSAENLKSFSYTPMPVRLVPFGKVLKTVNYPPFLSGNYYAGHLGFFCKEEIKFEKIVKIPFKFRLGTVEDCDKLEGKKNWRN